MVDCGEIKPKLESKYLGKFLVARAVADCVCKCIYPADQISLPTQREENKNLLNEPENQRVVEEPTIK